MSPKVSTSGAAPVRSYQTAFIQSGLPSERARECAAIEQDVLSGDEACFRPAEKRASEAKFLRVAEAPGGIEFGSFRQQLVDGNAALFGVHLRHRAAQTVGIEGTRQQRVDGDVVDHGLARNARDK